MELDDHARTVTVDYIDWPNSLHSTLTFHPTLWRLVLAGVRQNPRPACR
jgi:hypothetical protein